MGNGKAIRRLLVTGFLMSVLLGEAASFSVGGRNPVLLYGEIYLLVMFYVYMVRVFMRDRDIVMDRPVLLLAALYAFAHAVSMLVNGSDLFKCVLSIKNFAEGLALYLIVISLCRTRKDADWALYSLVIFVAVLSLTLVFKFAFGVDFTYRISKQMVDIGWGQSNYLASFMVLAIPVSLGLAVSDRGVMVRAACAGCCILMFFALVVTMSKGAALSLAVVLVVVLPVILKARAKINYAAVLAALGSSLIYLLPRYMPDSILNMNMMMLRYRMFHPDYNRLELISASWSDFLANPLFGMGPFETQVMGWRYETMPHNFVLQVFSELGLLGGAPFILIVSLFLYRAYKNCSSGDTVENYYIIAGIIATLMHGLLELTFQGTQYMFVFWMMMAVVSMRYRVVRRSTSPAALETFAGVSHAGA